MLGILSLPDNNFKSLSDNNQSQQEESNFPCGWIWYACYSPPLHVQSEHTANSKHSSIGHRCCCWTIFLLLTVSANFSLEAKNTTSLIQFEDKIPHEDTLFFLTSYKKLLLCNSRHYHQIERKILHQQNHKFSASSSSSTSLLKRRERNT